MLMIFDFGLAVDVHFSLVFKTIDLFYKWQDHLGGLENDDY